jgi:hypothetical protein
LPPRQRLEPDDAITIKRDNRLVIGHDGIRCDRGPKLPLNLDASLDMRVHSGLEEANG